MRNLPHGFDVYQVNVKTKRKNVQIFVTFSEKLNFISNGQKFDLKMSNWPAQNKLLDVNKTYIDIGNGQKFELKMPNWLVLRLIQ